MEPEDVALMIESSARLIFVELGTSEVTVEGSGVIVFEQAESMVHTEDLDRCGADDAARAYCVGRPTAIEALVGTSDSSDSSSPPEV